MIYSEKRGETSTIYEKEEKKMRIAVTGGTGFVGKALAKRFLEEGNQVVILTRKAKTQAYQPNLSYVEWLTEGSRPEEHLKDIDVFINLAGEGIGTGRWTAGKKEKILHSRLKATQEVIRIIKSLNKKPNLLINASAVEASLPDRHASSWADLTGMEFLSYVARRWEEEARKAEEMGIRTVLARFGILLGKEEGALPKMVMPYRFFTGGRVGSGKQWVSWIHIDDVVGLICHAIKHEEISGPIPVTSPNPVTMDRFGREIARILHRPHWLPIPGFLLKVALGEMALLLLQGNKADTERLLGLGYSFRYPDLSPALEDLLK